MYCTLQSETGVNGIDKNKNYSKKSWSRYIIVIQSRLQEKDDYILNVAFLTQHMNAL